MSEDVFKTLPLTADAAAATAKEPVAPAPVAPQKGAEDSTVASPSGAAPDETKAGQLAPAHEPIPAERGINGVTVRTF